MKLPFTILIFLILVKSEAQSLFPQKIISPIENCETNATDQDFSVRLNKRKSLSYSNESLTFAVAHHIFLNDSGDPSSNPVKENDIATIMSKLNKEFSKFGIYFESVCIEYHNDSRYLLEVPNSSVGSVVQEYGQEDALDIYYSIDPPYGGAASLPWNSRQFIAMNSDKIFDFTFLHEFGHVFGMFHTHSGPGYNAYCVTEELVDGSNCSTTGDLICDTPADPGNWWKNDGNCNWTGDCTDANGQLYNPDASNIMSYSPDECKSRFTTDQKVEMKKWARSDEMRKFRYDPSQPLKLIGKNFFCSSETQIIAIQGVNPSKIKWRNSSNLQIVSYGETLHVTPSSGVKPGKGWIEASYEKYCNEVKVRKEFWIRAPELKLNRIEGSCDRPIMVYEVLPVEKSLQYNWIVNGDVSYSVGGVMSNELRVYGKVGVKEVKPVEIIVGIFRRDCMFRKKVTLDYKQNCFISLPSERIWIYDTSNNLVFHGTEKDFTLLMRNLERGLYYIGREKNGKISRSKLYKE
ncbi:M43 family zinc metalloprotease [Ekhidna sp.]|uniref:M43 family zinc metalloprotease n=1 Tax=Ekhidna sp. TaxID=2608089 RepID=UPI0035180847